MERSDTPALQVPVFPFPTFPFFPLVSLPTAERLPVNEKGPAAGSRNPEGGPFFVPAPVRRPLLVPESVCTSFTLADSRPMSTGFLATRRGGAVRG